ncbi:ribonuclease P protein component [Paracoccus marinus]|uniref:ribonuclease P protein component n=1 Tax=Paracoccus marinus TaxID=288426 RepID=UPI001FE4F0AA|nr:ribonuclease P protein component [Paracoccus marinus]
MDKPRTEKPRIDKPRIERLRQRADFLRAASARRQGTAGFLLQARQRPDGGADGACGPDAAPAGAMRVGFTCSKKIGNAVARNRAKRRLRALAAEIMPLGGRPGWDYVLVGRPDATIDRAFADLRSDLVSALDRIHSQPEGQGGRPPRPHKNQPKNQPKNLPKTGAGA